jgi:hypothetical protein
VGEVTVPNNSTGLTSCSPCYRILPDTINTLVEISKKDMDYAMILEVFDVRVLHQAMGLASSPVAAGVDEVESASLFQNFMKTQAEQVGVNAALFGLGGVFLCPTTREICWETVVSRWADFIDWIGDQIRSGYRKKFCRILELLKYEDGHSELLLFYGCP